jgi:hypothetical protein
LKRGSLFKHRWYNRVRYPKEYPTYRSMTNALDAFNASTKTIALGPAEPFLDGDAAVGKHLGSFEDDYTKAGPSNWP